MDLTNREGTPIDPVPFLVVALLAAMLLVGWGPLYLRAHGFGLTVSVAVSVVLTVLAWLVLYYRFVWTANPLIRQEVPAATRYLRLLYGIAAGVIILLGLTALLYV